MFISLKIRIACGTFSTHRFCECANAFMAGSDRISCSCHWSFFAWARTVCVASLPICSSQLKFLFNVFVFLHPGLRGDILWNDNLKNDSLSNWHFVETSIYLPNSLLNFIKHRTGILNAHIQRNEFYEWNIQSDDKAHFETIDFWDTFFSSNNYR